MGSGGGDWSNLPKDMLEEVATRVATSDVVDFINFGDVCTSWQSVFVERRRDVPPSVPWILLPNKKEKDTRYCFVNPFSNELHLLNNLRLSNGYCGGSSEGWIVMAGWSKSKEVHLLNPFTSKRVSLPSFTEPYKMEKAIVSSITISNNVDSCMVMAITCWFEPALAFCKPGDDKWTIIPSRVPPCTDIIFCNGQFYALGLDSTLWVFCNTSMCHSNPTAEEISKLPDSVNGHNHYLVESSGDLLLVSLEFVLDAQKVNFDVPKVLVFKLDLLSKNWFEVKNMDDHTLFISVRNSISVSASNHPMHKPNCIYFALRRCLGIFSLKDGSFEPFPSSSSWGTPPVWITPSPW